MQLTAFLEQIEASAPNDHVMLVGTYTGEQTDRMQPGDIGVFFCRKQLILAPDTPSLVIRPNLLPDQGDPMQCNLCDCRVMFLELPAPHPSRRWPPMPC